MAGIYVTTKLNSEDQSKLRKFVDTLPLPAGTRMREKEYHITLAYSKQGFDYKHNTVVEGTDAKPSRWEIFGTGDDKVLVLLLESEVLQQRFQQLCAQGYVCKFPEYNPHITCGLAPPESVDISKFPVPQFNITVEYEYSEPIAEGSSYNPAEMCESTQDSFLSFIHFMYRSPL